MSPSICLSFGVAACAASVNFFAQELLLSRSRTNI
jgi:hypothetical protein